MARDVLHDRNGALAHERDGHRVGAHALARNAAGERRTNASGLLEHEHVNCSPHDIDAFLREHHQCGELDGGADEEWIWMTCTCGAVMSRTLEPARRH